MARYKVTEPGRRPLNPLLEPSPTCWQCTWVFRLKSLLWELKYLSGACTFHDDVPDDLSQPPLLPEWLDVAS